MLDMLGLSPTLCWAILGMALLILEIFTLSFVMSFFGVAALVVALLKAALGFDNLALEILVFAGLGFSCLFFFRKKLLKLMNRGPEVALDKAKVFVLTADIPPESTAKVEYQGVAWDAYNPSTAPLSKGDKVVVVDTEGIKLVVRPVGRS